MRDHEWIANTLKWGFLCLISREFWWRNELRLIFFLFYVLGVRHWFDAWATSFRDNLKKSIQSRFDDYHKNWPQFSFLIKRFVFYTYYFHRTSCVVRRRISFITLSLSHDIFILHHTHIQSKRGSYLKCPTVSLSLPRMMTESASSFFFRRPSPFFLSLSSLSTYRYKRNENVCVYICACGFFRMQRKKRRMFHPWEIFHSFSMRREKARHNDVQWR